MASRQAVLDTATTQPNIPVINDDDLSEEGMQQILAIVKNVQNNLVNRIVPIETSLSRIDGIQDQVQDLKT